MTLCTNSYSFTRISTCRAYFRDVKGSRFLAISVFDKQANVAGYLTWCKHLPNGVLCDILLHMANCASSTHRASAVLEMNIITHLLQLIDTTKRLLITLHRPPCKPHCRDQQSQIWISLESCGYLLSM